MIAPELKPCPFCGHHPRMLITAPSIYGNEIECTNGNCPSEPHVRKDTPDEAIEAWNTRADLHEATKAQLAKVVEALRSLHHAVCGETGFAQCVRDHSNTAYPWPALDEADVRARAVLEEIEKGEPK